MTVLRCSADPGVAGATFSFVSPDMPLAAPLDSRAMLLQAHTHAARRLPKGKHPAPPEAVCHSLKTMNGASWACHCDA